MKRSVVIIGAGISGLAAAYRLRRSALADGRELELTVLDAAGRAGGVIGSLASNGCLLETGPDSMLSEKPRGQQLCKELGLSGELIGTRESSRRSYIARGDRLIAVPEGFYLMAPAKLLPMLASDLFSPMGKLRVLLEPLVPAKRDGSDESLADFVRRRLGREALERVAQPMVAGIYTADPERLSLRATMPQFLDMEKEHGSVVRGMWAKSSEMSAASGPRYSMFLSLASGMERLVSRLVEELPSGTLRTGVAAQCISQTSGGWRVECSNGVFEADAVCLALGAPDASRVLAGIDSELAGELATINYASTATVNLVYERSGASRLPEAAGFVVPATEGRALIACTFVDKKFEGRAAPGTTVVRAFVGGALSPESLELSDDAMVEAVCRDLARLTGLPDSPLQSLVHRHPAAMPQYEVGHLDRVGRIEAGAGQHRGLALAGNYFRGPGIPDCIDRAEQAASSLYRDLFSGAY